MAEAITLPPPAGEYQQFQKESLNPDGIANPLKLLAAAVVIPLVLAGYV